MGSHREDAVVDESTEAFDAAVDRAHALGIIECFLARAYADQEWRRRVEQALRVPGALGRLLVGGAKPAGVWDARSLLRRRIIDALTNDTAAFTQFATTCPALEGVRPDEIEDHRAFLSSLDSLVAVLACYGWPDEWDLKAETIGVACDEIEQHQAAESVEDALVECADVALETAYPLDEELLGQVECLQRLLEERDRQITALKRNEERRVAEVGRKDRKNQELRADLRSAKNDADQAVIELKAMREQRDEYRREAERLRSQANSSREGIRTVEEKRADETRRMQESLADLRARLQVSADFAEALQKRIGSLERELDDERQRRAELEETLEASGFDEMVASSQSLQQAVTALLKFQEGVESYASRQRAKQEERMRLQAAAELQRQAADDAMKAQEEAARAWELREKERLEEREDALFPNGAVDHVIIDGHNLLHRTFRPQDEKSTRRWLERMVELMALRLEDRGWAACIHLVFDTKSDSNEHAMGHGVKVYFHNNVTEGGADARIAQILQEANPSARYMVVSTDRRHVWRDTLDLMQSEGTDVDLVQVEMLAEYLQTLDESEAAS